MKEVKNKNILAREHLVLIIVEKEVCKFKYKS